MSDVNYSVPHVNDDISCYDSMSCLCNENGKSCQSEGRINNDEPVAYFSFSTTTTNDNDDSGTHLHSCEGTVVNEDDNSTSASSDLMLILLVLSKEWCFSIMSFMIYKYNI